MNRRGVPEHGAPALPDGGGPGEDTIAAAAAQGLLTMQDPQGVQGVQEPMTPDTQAFWDSHLIPVAVKWQAVRLAELNPMECRFIKSQGVPDPIVEDIILNKEHLSEKTLAFLKSFPVEYFSKAVDRMHADARHREEGAPTRPGAQRSVAPPQTQFLSEPGVHFPAPPDSVREPPNHRANPSVALDAPAAFLPLSAPPAADTAAEGDDQWKAEVQAAVRKAQTEALAAFISASESADLENRISDLEDRYKAAQNNRAAEKTKWADYTDKRRRCRENIMKIEKDITVLKLQQNALKQQLIPLETSIKASEELGTRLFQTARKIEAEHAALRLQYKAVKESEERKARYARQLVQPPPGVVPPLVVNSELKLLQKVNQELSQRMNQFLAKEKKKKKKKKKEKEKKKKMKMKKKQTAYPSDKLEQSDDSGDIILSESSSDSDDDDSDDDDDDDSDDDDKSDRGKNPKLSTTPLFTSLEDGKKWYGPRPNSRHHEWHNYMTKKDWKQVHLISPYCRACNGNTSQGHANTKRCRKARKVIESIKKIGRAKTRKAKSETSLKEQLAVLKKEKDKKAQTLNKRMRKSKGETRTSKKHRILKRLE